MNILQKLVSSICKGIILGFMWYLADRYLFDGVKDEYYYWSCGVACACGVWMA